MRMMATKKKNAKIGNKKVAAKKPLSKGFGSTKSVATVAIPTCKLNTGVSVPVLCFGTYKCDGAELKQALESAIAAGYRHYDTARAYRNEAIVGAAILESGIPREEFFITSKLWGSDHGEQRARQAIEASLSELGTYLDCLLIHGPDNSGNSPEETIALRQQTWSVMEEQHAAGSLRAIGVSNFEPRHIESILACGSVTPAINQIECHAYLAQPEIRAFCADRGILVEAFGSVGAAGLRADPVVQQIASSHKRSPAQISLRHTLQSGRGAVVLAKSLTPKRILDNTKLFDFELSKDECAALDALDAGKRSYWDNSQVP